MTQPPTMVAGGATVRSRRAWRRVTAASLLLVLASATMGLRGEGADAAEGEAAPELSDEGLGGYTSEASGAPLSVLTFEPVLPVPVDPGEPHLRADLAYVLTDLSTGPQGRALASAVWPGPLIGDGFPTIASLLVGEEAPEYPLKTDARSPGQEPEVCSEVVPGTGMCSFAEGLEVRSRAQAAESPAPEALAVGTLDAESYGRVLDGRAVTTIVVTAHDVRLLGGVITIDAVHTVVETFSDGTAGASSGRTTVQGLRIADQGFVVDEDGVRPTEGDSLTGALPEVPGREELVEALGIDVRLLPHEEAVDGARASRLAGGLEIRVDLRVLREQVDTTPIEDLVKLLPPVDDPGLPEELTDPFPVEVFQEPYLTLLPAFLLAPEIVFVVGGASSESVASEPLSFDFGAPTAPLPASPPTAPTDGPTVPSTTPGPTVELGSPTPVPNLGSGGGTAGASDAAVPPLVADGAAPVAQPDGAGTATDQPFGGIPPLLGMVGLLGVAVGSWALRTTSAAVFGTAGACATGNDESLPDLKGA